ncbi:MAG: hypothetical protein ABI183_26500, partial [Polyangiaceae bacterium]
MRYVASTLISSVLYASIVGGVACSGSDDSAPGATAANDGGSNDASPLDAATNSKDGAVPLSDGAPNTAC